MDIAFYIVLKKMTNFVFNSDKHILEFYKSLSMDELKHFKNFIKKQNDPRDAESLKYMDEAIQSKSI